MLNQVVLVGRLTRNISVNKSNKGFKVATVSLAIPRSFKNSEGIYDTDFVDCIAFDTIAENTSEYCHKGDIVGVKGRIQSRIIEKDGKNENIMEIILKHYITLQIMVRQNHPLMYLEIIIHILFQYHPNMIKMHQVI